MDKIPLRAGSGLVGPLTPEGSVYSEVGKEKLGEVAWKVKEKRD